MFALLNLVEQMFHAGREHLGNDSVDIPGQFQVRQQFLGVF